jgi:site-specific DNA recombinase
VTVSPESARKVKPGAGSPSTTGKTASRRRAVGIVRVSHVGGRSGESFVSPDQQRDRIRDACRAQGLRLVDTFEELDISGKRPLEQRPGLFRAVQMIEAERAHVIVVAYMDRLVRKLKVQLEVVERVERAGGEILTLDHGALTNGNALQRLSSAMLGAFNEYQATAGGERSHEGKVKAVSRGVAPFPNLPLGYRRIEAPGTPDHRRTELDPETVPIVAEAFRLRSQGSPIREVREHIRAHGVPLSYHGVQAMLCSRFYLGELHFGSLVNLEAHPALVDAVTWNRAQRQRVPRGRKPKSERLLARLSVLRCATCGARMVVGTSQPKGKGGKRYGMYRCPPVSDCPQRVTISADLAEQAVEDEVRRLLQGMRGKATAKSGATEAAREYERLQAELESATRVALGAGIEEETATIERLAELRQARDDALERLVELQDIDAAAFVVDVDADWNLLTVEERRALIRAVVALAVVKPGRGLDRISIEARS